jgi:ribosomal-protein-alanine N-acetyltransferase
LALLDWMSADVGLRVEGEGVVLRPPRAADYVAWSDLRRRSKAFLQPWEPTWPADDLSRAAFRRRLAAYQRDMDLGYGYAFLVFRRGDGELVGGITLSNIRRGVAQMGQVGYWVGEPYARRGYTLAAVRARPARAASPRGGVHSGERGVALFAPEGWLRTRGPGTGLSEN